MAKAYGVTHKCALPVNNVPMLKRVVMALRAAKSIRNISISIEAPEVVGAVLGKETKNIAIVPSKNSAPLSAFHAIEKNPAYPILLTTADHALLPPTCTLPRRLTMKRTFTSPSSPGFHAAAPR